MNKYIILLIILLLIIIFYFRYKINKNNLENFLEGNVNVNTVISNLERNNLIITPNGGLAVRTKTGETLNVSFSNNVINLGRDIKVDPSNNSLQCSNKLTLDRDGKLSDTNNKYYVDPSGNITIEDFIFNKAGNFTKKDNSIKMDPIGNLEFGNFIFDNNKKISKKDNSFKVDMSGNIDSRDYTYSVTGNLIKKDNSFKVDMSGVITTSDYTINTKDRTFNKNDNSIIDTSAIMKCGAYESDKSKNIVTSFGNRIKIGNTYYNISNNNISSNGPGPLSDVVISIDPNTVNFNSFNYVYDINKNDLSGNIGTQKQFNIPNQTISSQIFLGNNNIIYNYDGSGSIIYKVSKIVLEKPSTANTYLIPLHIASIRFYDHNDQVIPPSYYRVDISGIANGQYNPNGITSAIKYYDSNFNKNSSYGGPKVDSYSLFLNKTIMYVNVNNILQPQIDVASYHINITSANTYAKGIILSNSYDFIGHGLYNINYIDTITKPLPLQIGVTQSYTFTFTQPVFIKYVEVENRKGNSATGRIFGSYIDTYLNINNTPIFDLNKNRIKCVRGFTGQSLSTDNTIILPPLTANGSTKLQPKGRIEKYNSVDYNNTTIPPSFDPIVRYYIQ